MRTCLQSMLGNLCSAEVSFIEPFQCLKSLIKLFKISRFVITKIFAKFPHYVVPPASSDFIKKIEFAC